MALTRVRVAVASATLLFGLASASAGADGGDEARLAHVFQDNMVLQQGVPAPVWGWAAPGTQVEIAFDGQRHSTEAGQDGRWKAVLDPLEARAEGGVLKAQIGGVLVTRENVLVGEVWLAAGQSNMNHGGPDVSTGLYPHHVSPGTGGGLPEIRIMKYGFGASLEPLEDVDPVVRGDAPWEILQEDPPLESMNLSRYFARMLRDHLGVPVGIVHVAVSGTNQAAWMPREALESFPGKGEFPNFYRQFLNQAGEKLAKNGYESFAAFKEAESAWRLGGEGKWPGNRALFDFPSGLYNTRVHPVAPLAIRGVIWHQGEGGPPGPYGERLVAQVEAWRERFGQDFFFVWGTLSRNTTGNPPLEPRPAWFYRSSTNEEMRKAAGLFGDEGKAAMVEFYDLGDHDTHFSQKAEAGRRMGLAALSVAYDQDHVYTGPRLAEAEVEGSRLVARFDFAGDGWRFRPSIEGISGFYVRGEDGPYQWAEVEMMDERTLALSHPAVPRVVEAGYAVNQNPHETLFNGAGLPASPFRWNMGRLPWAARAGGESLVSVKVEGDAQPVLNLAHVRREGYAFQLLLPRGGPKDLRAEVVVGIPAEWESWEIRSKGRAVESLEVSGDGRKQVTFEAAVDGRWIVVGERGEVERLEGIKRF